MPLEFIQRGYYTIFGNIPAGGVQIITDTPDPLPGPPATISFRHWTLPSWFPRKALISRAAVIYESVGYNTLLTDMAIPPGNAAGFPTVTENCLFDLREYAFRFLNSKRFQFGRTNSEAMMWIDPGGHHYNDATPPGSEASDYSPLTMLFHCFESGPMMQYDTGTFAHPYLLDRDAGDKLAIQFNNSDTLNWAAVSLSYLALTPIQPS